MKPSKKKPAKKKNRYVADYVDKKRNPIITKLRDLKYRINDHYNAVGGKISTKTDKEWVMSLIDLVRAGGSITQERMIKANDMWRKYS